MHYLITGGAGFIGSHLSELLLERGHDVTVLDDLSTGSRDNFEALEGRPGFSFELGSVTDEARVDALVARADAVVHLAAAVGVRLVLDEPVRTLETNVEGTSVVLRSAARHRARCLLASSSEVYGKSTRIPFHEDDELLLGATRERRWSYACSKAMGEWLALAHAKSDGLEAVVVRLFNTVGPRQTGRYGMVLPSFAAQAVRDEPITVFGDGRQTRAFLHVLDCVEACARLLESDAALGRVFNVGGEREIEIRELAQLVKRTARSSSRVVELPLREAYGYDFQDLRRRRPDTSRLRELVGWAPRRTLEESVADVVDHARSPAAAI